MQNENLAIVRRLVEAFNRRDMDAVVGDLDPDVVLSEWPDAPGARAYRGPEGVRAALDSWFEIWEWMQVEIEELVPAGDSVVVVLHQRAKGAGSAVEVELKTGNVYTLRDGKVTRMDLFTNREDALKAVGLDEANAVERSRES